MLCGNCHMILTPNYVPLHTEEVCRSKSYNGGTMCDIHQDEFTLQGGVCKLCCPEYKVFSIPQHMLHLLNNMDVTKELLYTIKGGNVVNETINEFHDENDVNDKNEHIVDDAIHPDLSIVIKSVEHLGVIGIELRPSLIGEFPHNYIGGENQSKIIEEINNIEIFREWRENTPNFKVTLRGQCNFLRMDVENPEGDGVLEPKYFNTVPYAFSSMDYIMSEDRMITLLRDVEHRFNLISNSMQGSGWQFINCEKIKCTFYPFHSRKLSRCIKNDNII